MASWAKTDIRDCLTRAFQRISERTGYTPEQLEEFVGTIDSLMEPPKKTKITCRKEESEQVSVSPFESVTVVIKKPGRKKTPFYTPTVDPAKPVPQSVEELFPMRITEPAQSTEETTRVPDDVKETMAVQSTEETTDVPDDVKETMAVQSTEETTNVPDDVKETTDVQNSETVEHSPQITEELPAPVSIKRKRPRIRINREEEEQASESIQGFEITHLEKRKSSNIRDPDYQKLVEHHFQLLGEGEEVEAHRRRIAGKEYYVTDKGGYVYDIAEDGSVAIDRLVGKVDDLDDEHIIMF